MRRTADPAGAGLRYMRRALELARRGRLSVAPNPMVGAVLVRRGRVVGEGYHRRFGEAHAETRALAAAGADARGATLYTNLEPCAHHGRTPPCVEALLAAGVARVVASMRDPNPHVRGRGFRALRRAGVRVETGLLTAEAALLNERFIRWTAAGRPYVILKAGMSLDGRIGGAGARPLALTSPASRQRAHRLRAAVDAVVIGAGTLRADDPLLTARPGGRPGARQPLRVVLDSRYSTPRGARLFSAPGGGPVIIFGTLGLEARRRRLQALGAEVVAVAPQGTRPQPGRVLDQLGRRGVRSILIEGGGETAWSFLEAGRVDHLVWFVAPCLLGGGAVPVVGGPGAATRGGSIPLAEWRISRVGPELLVEAIPAASAAERNGRHVHRDRDRRRAIVDRREKRERCSPRHRIPSGGGRA